MDVPPPHQVRPLRRAEYEQLVELGAFRNERIELLDGALAVMPPIGAPHNSAVQQLGQLLIPALLGRAIVRIQSSFAALEDSEPEPDVAVVPVGKYNRSHPDHAELIVEVAESSLAIDRMVKQRIYARCRVPEYWIVNLAECSIEVYTGPREIAYADMARFGAGDSIRLSRFPDVEIRVSDVILD
jgi:Uma2 family endonuclease